MQAILVQCSSRVIEEKVWKGQMFLSGISSSGSVARKRKMMKEVAVPNLLELMKMLKKCGICCIQMTFKYQSCNCATKFRQLHVYKKAWTIAFSPMTMAHITGFCQAVSDPTFDYWNGTPHPVPLIWLRMTCVSKNKFCLKGTKISGYWRNHLPPKKCDVGTESYSI